MMIRNLAIALFLFCAAFWAVNPAMAAIDQAGAERLRAAINDVLKAQAQQIAAEGGELHQDGELQVEPDETYYAATLPFLTLREKNGNSLALGMIALNAIPDQAPGRWKITIAIPTPLAFQNSGDVQTATLDIAQQNFSGLWDEKLGGFLKVAADYNGITLREGKTISSLSSLSVRNDYKPVDDSKGTIEAQLSAGGFSRTPPNPLNAALPTHAELKVRVENLPLKSLASATDYQSARRLMTQAGTIITIENASGGNGVYSLSAAGKMAVKDSAPFGFLGKMAGKIVNLEKVVEILKTPTPAQEAKPLQTTSLLAVIAVLQMVGQQEKAPDGAITRHYTLETTDKNAVLMNGIDIKTLFSFGKKEKAAK